MGPTESPAASNGWLGWMGTLLAITVAIIIFFFLIVALTVCCCCKRKGRNMAAGRGQADGAGGHGVVSSVPSSSNSSSNSSNSSPNYGEINLRSTPSGQAYNMVDSSRSAGSHVFFAYPAPNGRDVSGLYSFQGGYYPMRKDNQCYKMDRKYAEQRYGGGLNGHSIVGLPAD